MPDVAADQVWSVLLAGVETRGCSAVFAVTKRLKVKQDACSNCSGSRSASRHAAASRNPQTRRSASSRKVCRYPSAHREFMARHAVELVDADLYYRNPKSKWCSSPLIVNKVDGDFRMAVDVRLSMPKCCGYCDRCQCWKQPSTACKDPGYIPYWVSSSVLAAQAPRVAPSVFLFFDRRGCLHLCAHGWYEQRCVLPVCSLGSVWCISIQGCWSGSTTFLDTVPQK